MEHEQYIAHCMPTMRAHKILIAEYLPFAAAPEEKNGPAYKC